MRRDAMGSLLFVYGTLRRGAEDGLGRSPRRMLEREAEWLGPARFTGRLFDLGAYPGAVPDPSGRDWVLGELLRLSRPGAALDRLDAYEGCPAGARDGEYRRERLWSERLGALWAWVYVYNRSVTGPRRVATRDYGLGPALPAKERGLTDLHVERGARGRRGRTVPMGGVRALAWAALCGMGMLSGTAPLHAQTCVTIAACTAQLRFGETELLRQEAARTLGERGAQSALPFLAVALKEDGSEFVRVHAAIALGWMRGGDAVAPLADALRGDSREKVREAAAQALGRLARGEGAAALGTALAADESYGVRIAAAAALGRIKGEGPGAAALAAAVREDGRAEVRVQAAASIGALKADSAAPALMDALKADAVPLVRTAAAQALAVFGGEPVTRALAEAVTGDGDREVRREAARALGQRDDRTAAPELVRAVQSDGALEVRQAAAVALGLLGGDLARDALAYYATNAENEALRRSAKDALEAMRPDSPPKAKDQ